MTLGRRGRFGGLAAAGFVLAACDALTASSAPPSEPAFIANVQQLLGPWSATPFAVEPSLLALIDHACRTSDGLGQEFPAGVRLVIVDARGNGIVQAYYAGSGTEAYCADLRIHADGTVEAMRGGGWGTSESTTPVAGGIRIKASGTTGSTGEVTYMWGGYGPNVRRIVIEQQAWPPVFPAMQDGWWAVSTRGDWARGAHITGYDQFGKQVVQVPIP